MSAASFIGSVLVDGAPGDVNDRVHSGPDADDARPAFGRTGIVALVHRARRSSALNRGQRVVGTSISPLAICSAKASSWSAMSSMKPPLVE
jgi:hypothetical protein